MYKTSKLAELLALAEDRHPDGFLLAIRYSHIRFTILIIFYVLYLIFSLYNSVHLLSKY